MLVQDADRAEAIYRKAIHSNPNHAYALYNLAVLLEEKAVAADTLVGMDEVKRLLAAAVAAAPGQ